MSMGLSTKTKRTLSQIWPFGVLWCVIGWIFLFVEVATTGTLNPNPGTTISLDWDISIFATIAMLACGMFVGFIEINFIRRRFKRVSFTRKIIYKFAFYGLLLFLIVVITFPIAASIELNLPLYDPDVWGKFQGFLFSLTFLSTGLQLAVTLLLILLYASISEYFGYDVFRHFLTGKYHKPKEEHRIFMFLDMKSSTKIAEQLGHIKYFDLLQDYYTDLSEAIIKYHGEIYQYVGDEVVITWRSEKGLQGQNCVKCFYAMKDALDNRKDYYSSCYGVAPSFKAGVHLGQVTTGEIGDLKKDIVFSGDVLNTTARIQALCNQFDADLLASEDLVTKLGQTDQFLVNSIGNIELRGKSRSLELYKIDENQSQR